MKWRIKKQWVKQAVCILAGVLLFLLSQWTSQDTKILREGRYLPRNSHGQEDSEYLLKVKGIGSEELTLSVPVRARGYDRETAEQIMDQAYEALGLSILGENASLQEVRSDLKLPSTIPDEGIRITWESDQPKRLNHYGEVNLEDCNPLGETVFLTANMRVDEFSAGYVYSVMVYPPTLGMEEQEEQEFMKLLTDRDKEQKNMEELELPKDWRGKTLTYETIGENENFLLLFLGVGVAVLIPWKEREDVKKLKKKRELELGLDFAEFLSKLLVFLGAGFTVRKAWERMVKDYENARARGQGRKRCVYEEMAQTYYQMEAGISEVKAYEDFGTRCHLLPYRKVSGLLVQNLKTGTKNLRKMLSLEMSGAFEQRKSSARRLGEEASTKLLLPLFFMLAIVMVMIVTPAMLSFQL